MNPGPSGPSQGHEQPADAEISRRIRKGPSRLHVLQVQAFLDAAEDVGIDAEVMEDILDGLGADEPENGIGADDAPGSEESDDEEDSNTLELAAFAEEAEQAWTKQEINLMKRHLKDHGMASFLREYVVERQIPIPRLLYAFGICLCKELREKRLPAQLYFLKVALSRELRRREKRPEYNTVDDAVNLIKHSRNIVILTGAGISVSCGIPDFRSRNGLYATLKERGDYDLDDPQQMFDIHYFRENPAVFYSFASQIYPSNFTPSPCHRFIKLIEEKDKLLRNYTQNIDTLETLAGVQRVLQCHGSFATATCLNCRARVPGAEIEDDIMQHRVSLCKTCNVTTPSASKPTNKHGAQASGSGWKSDPSDEDDDAPEFPPGIMKPDITFFHEKLTDEFDRCLTEDREKVDLLIIMGTSLQVSPVSDTITYLPHSVPQILINKTPIRHINPDIILLGNADDIVQHLCSKLGWDLPPPRSLTVPQATVRKRGSAEIMSEQEPRRIGNSHVWLFEGAEGGRWVEELERSLREQSTEASSTSSSPPAEQDKQRFKKPRTE